MSARQKEPVTFPEFFRLPVVVDLTTAAHAVGISVNTAYKLVHQNRFPCPVLRPCHAYKVPTVGLMRALGIELVPADTDAIPDGATFAARIG